MKNPELLDKILSAIPDFDLDAALPGFLRAAKPLDKSTLQECLERTYSPRPVWAPHYPPTVRVDKTVHAGAFAIGYFVDPERVDPSTHRRGEMMVVLSRRGKEKNVDGLPLYSATGGGYREFGDTPADTGEQPAENASREIREETVDDQNAPVLDIAPERLKDILKVGTDYRNAALPVDYVGYGLPLTTQEYRAITEHGRRLATDATYKEAVFKHTKGEVDGYEALPLSEALKLNPSQFAHPHEQETLHDLDAMLASRGAGRRNGGVGL